MAVKERKDICGCVHERRLNKPDEELRIRQVELHSRSFANT